MSNKTPNKKVNISSNQGIGYSGSVKISYTDKNGKKRTIRTKNDGEMGLLYFILYALGGKNAENYQPKYLQAYYEDGGEYKIALSSVVPLKTSVIDDFEPDKNTEDNPPKITFLFQIPKTSIIVNNGSITRLRIVNNLYRSSHDTEELVDKTHLCATIDTNIPTDLDSNILVYWTMSFRNLPSTYFNISAYVTNGSLEGTLKAYPGKIAKLKIVPNTFYTLPEESNIHIFKKGTTDNAPATIVSYDRGSGYLSIGFYDNLLTDVDISAECEFNPSLSAGLHKSNGEYISWYDLKTTYPDAFSSFVPGGQYAITANGITSYFDDALEGCLVLGNDVRSIGRYAFSHCSGLKIVKLNDDLVEIGSGAFHSCSNIESVVINTNDSKLEKIDSEAFYNCSNLQNITIPNSILDVGTNVFYGCPNNLFNISEDDVFYIGNNTKPNLVLVKPKKLTEIESFILPPDCEIIASSAFNYFFYGNSSLKSFTLNDTLRVIGETAFRSCSNSNFTSIGCPGNELPQSLTNIKTGAFENASNITAIYYSGTIAQWLSIEKGYHWDNGTGNYTIYCTDGTIPKTENS